jgi:hypothetical protein
VAAAFGPIFPPLLPPCCRSPTPSPYAPATQARGPAAKRSIAAGAYNWTGLWRDSRRMLEFCLLIGGGLLLVGLPGLAYPALVGWRTRRDALFALGIAAVLLSVALFA